MIVDRKQYMTLLAMLCGIVCFLLLNNSSSTTAEAYVVIQSETEEKQNPTTTSEIATKGRYDYIEITESCYSYIEKKCIPAYSGPGVEYTKIYELHNGMVLKIKSKIERNGQVWYRVYFDEWLRYPDRVNGDWYIPAVAGRIVTDDGEKLLASSTPISSKRIVVDLSDHMLYAYDGNVEFLMTKISTGVNYTPTPVGMFTVYKKTPSRYMQGPLKGVTNIPFDLPGVPWNMYFTYDGAVIHGSYWHDRYGTEQSSGCINLPPLLAKLLYDWADLGTTVTIQE